MEETRNDLLIQKVKEFQCLYNVNSPDYRDIKKRQESWDGIGRQLEISGNEAKNCWDRLRRCFSNTRNRRNKLKPTSNTKKWKFENQMAFLIPFMETKMDNQNECSSSVTSTMPDVISEEPKCNAFVETDQSFDLIQNDDTDLFFLNMSRMTKQLPKVDQARIKLELSNLVLSAEIKHQQMLSSTLVQHSICTFQESNQINEEQYYLNL